VAQPVLSEQQLQEKIKANRILDMYLTDAGITGFETNQYGAPSSEFIVPGPYEKIPDGILALAKEHNVRIMPSQLSKKADGRVLLPMVMWLFNVIVLLSILVTVIIINKRVSNIEKLIKK
jgi:hypothetical protein